MPQDKVLDINDPELQKEMVEANPDADFFEAPPPPPDNTEYQAMIMLSDKGIEARRKWLKTDTDAVGATGPKYAAAFLEIHIEDPGQPWDGTVTRYYADSLIWDKKETSKLHSVLRALGKPAMGVMSVDQLIRHSTSVFSSELRCFVKGIWQAQVKEGDVYRTVKTGMRNFPLLDPANPSLGYDPWVIDVRHKVVDPSTKQLIEVGTDEPVRAYFNVTKFIKAG